MDRRHPRNIPARPLVLIVDDHDDTREMYVASLTLALKSTSLINTRRAS